MKKIKNLLTIKKGFTLSKKGQTGFTLIELLIYMGLMTVLLTIFTELFITIIDNQLTSSNTSNVAIDGRFIYSRFIYDVNRAEAIVMPLDYASPSSELDLVINGQPYIYQLTNNNLVVTDPTGSYNLNGEGTTLTSLYFTKVGSTSAKNTVQLDFTIKGLINNRGIVEKEDFQTTAGLR